MVVSDVEVNYIVYYDSGRCEYGDHTTGIEVFRTKEEAKAFAAKFESDHVLGEGAATVIQGRFVEEE